MEPWISVSTTQDPRRTDGRDDGARFEPAFLDGFERGARFAVWWSPAARAPRGTVLCVPSPYREGLSARRVISAQAWRLAARGWMVLVPDLYGCGDSPGEESDATLAVWRRDLLRCATLARQRALGPTVLWSMAAGGLLAVDLTFALDQLLDAIVLWQPRADAGAIDEDAAATHFSPQLISALSTLTMQPPPIADGGRQPATAFFETLPAGATSAALAPATGTLLKSWLDAGYLVTARTVRIPARRTSAGTSANANAAVDASAGPPGAALPEALFDATLDFLDQI